MRIAIAHNAVGADAAPDERDVLVQVDAVRDALQRLGHDCVIAPCDLNLHAHQATLRAAAPACVWNLIESLGGYDHLAPVAALLWEAMGLPYTGAPAHALLLTTQKIHAKERLAQSGLPTPPWRDPLRDDAERGREPDGVEAWIVKAVSADASVGLDDTAIVPAGGAAWRRAVAARRERYGGDWFAEAYIEGREFNLSVLGGEGRPEVLPPAEIVFDAFPVGKPRIVGYAAKWDAGSFEYAHTPRRFEFPATDRRLLGELTALAERCWDACGLRGYARVDFRVDRRGRPWILEVNANPCLAPDAGFAAAVARASLAYHEAVARIVADALRQAGVPHARAEAR